MITKPVDCAGVAVDGGAGTEQGWGLSYLGMRWQREFHLPEPAFLLRRFKELNFRFRCYLLASHCTCIPRLGQGGCPRQEHGFIQAINGHNGQSTSSSADDTLVLCDGCHRSHRGQSMRKVDLWAIAQEDGPKTQYPFGPLRKGKRWSSAQIPDRRGEVGQHQRRLATPTEVV
eukprot:6208309-Pleurochrysis_carterae.AAC.1